MCSVRPHRTPAAHHVNGHGASRPAARCARATAASRDGLSAEEATRCTVKGADALGSKERLAGSGGSRT